MVRGAGRAPAALGAVPALQRVLGRRRSRRGEAARWPGRAAVGVSRLRQGGSRLRPALASGGTGALRRLEREGK